jgi:hypothetical protein
MSWCAKAVCRGRGYWASDEKLGTCGRWILPLIDCLLTAMMLALTKRGVILMPRKRPPFVEVWRDRHGKLRVYFRKERVHGYDCQTLSARKNSIKPHSQGSSRLLVIPTLVPPLAPSALS